MNATLDMSMLKNSAAAAAKGGLRIAADGPPSARHRDDGP